MSKYYDNRDVVLTKNGVKGMVKTYTHEVLTGKRKYELILKNGDIKEFKDEEIVRLVLEDYVPDPIWLKKFSYQTSYTTCPSCSEKGYKSIVKVTGFTVNLKCECLYEFQKEIDERSVRFHYQQMNELKQEGKIIVGDSTGAGHERRDLKHINKIVELYEKDSHDMRFMNVSTPGSWSYITFRKESKITQLKKLSFSLKNSKLVKVEISDYWMEYIAENSKIYNKMYLPLGTHLFKFIQKKYKNKRTLLSSKVLSNLIDEYIETLDEELYGWDYDCKENENGN